jgi:hypothetical protein
VVVRDKTDYEIDCGTEDGAVQQDVRIAEAVMVVVAMMD